MVSAQYLKSNKKGLSASLQSNQMGIVFPIWVSNNSAIVPHFSALWVEDAGTDYAVGLSYRKYRHKNSSVHPYFGIGASLVGLTIKDEDAIIDYIFGVNSGAEYFFSDQFSIGIEAQLNVSKSDYQSLRFGNPGGLNLNTGSILLATIYY